MVVKAWPSVKLQRAVEQDAMSDRSSLISTATLALLQQRHL